MINKAPYKAFATDSYLIQERKFGNKARDLIKNFHGLFEEFDGDTLLCFQKILSDSLSILNSGALSYWVFDEQKASLTCKVTTEKNKSQLGQVLNIEKYPDYFEALYSDNILAVANTKTNPATAFFWDNPLSDFRCSSLLDVKVQTLDQTIGLIAYELEDKIDLWPESRINFISSIATVFSNISIQSKEKNILNALKKANSELEVIMHTVDLGLWSFNFKERLFSCNDKVLEVYGIDRSEMDGSLKSFAKYWPEKQEKVALMMLKNLLHGNTVNNTPFIINAKDGKQKTVLVSASPIYDQNGKIEIASGVYHEITDLEILRKEQSKNENRLQAILDSTNIGTWEWDLISNQIIMNQRCADIFGIDYKDIRETTRDLWLEQMHPEDFPKASKNVWRHFRGEQAYYDINVRIKRKKGNYIWVNEHGQVSSWSEDGTPLIMHGTTKIIHEQLVAENALNELASQLTKYSGYDFFDQCLLYLCKVLDVDNGLICKIEPDKQWKVERSCENLKITNTINNDILDTLINKIVDDEFSYVIDGANELLGFSKKENITSYAGILLNSKRGEHIGVLLFYGKNPIYHPTIIERLLYLFRNAIGNEMERLQNESLRNELIETTSRQNNRLKNFSFITSHNIRAAVSNIQGLTDLMMADGEASYDMLSLLQQATANLDISIKNTSDLLQLEERTGDLDITHFSIPEIIQLILDKLGGIINSKKIELDINVPDPSEIYTNRGYLESILFNIISNAFKYGINKSNPKVDLIVENHMGGYNFIIKDYGKGIDLESYGDQIFELGSRLEQSSDGQGFGLFMTKHQIEILNGRIEVKSELNKGSTFSIFIPNFDQIESYKS